MTQRLATLAALAAASASMSGCASIMERAPGAPEWFEAKAQEIRGEGYPRLRDVPEIRAPLATAEETQQRASTLSLERKEIADETVADPIPTPDEIRARAAQLRAEADKTVRPGSRPASTASGAP
jgi:hypothetical protein